jgi:hypothetical protein
MDPLLTEFDEHRRFGRFLTKVPYVRSLLPSKTDLRGFKLAKTFFFVALATSILSVCSNAGILLVELTNRDPAKAGEKIPVAFGYLYEFNAAFLYLFVAPFFVFVGVRFLRNAQFALRGLAARKFLVRNAKAPNRANSEDPLVILGKMNRSMFRPAFLVAIVGVAAFIIVGTELWPTQSVLKDRGDYWTLAFGYVQAPFIKSYEQKSLADLEHQGRRVKPVSGISDDKGWKEQWYVGSVQGGPATRTEKFFFWLFLAFALGIQVLFVPFAVWIFFKAIFLLRTVYKAIAPDKKSPLELKLDFGDDDKSFGMHDLHQAYNYLVAIIFTGAIGTASVVIANVSKGSLGGGAILPVAGQFTTTFLPLILFFVLGAFLFFLRVKTEESREHYVHVLDQREPKTKKQKTELEETRKLACAQSAWPDAIFKTWFGTALPSYIFPVVLIGKRPELADAICKTWLALANAFDGLISPIRRIFPH